MSYEIRREDGILRVVFAGTFANADLLYGALELVALENAEPMIPNRIADLRSVERLEIDFAGLLSVAESRRRQHFNNSFKTAIVVEDIVHYGFARMFQTLNDHRQIVIAIFGNENDADAWLGLPGFTLPMQPWQPVN